MSGPEGPSGIAEWNRHDVRVWLEARLAARFPGQFFGNMLTKMETLHLIDGRILLQLTRTEWQEACPSIGARKVRPGPAV